MLSLGLEYMALNDITMRNNKEADTVDRVV